jgi:hypothetical protein
MPTVKAMTITADSLLSRPKLDCDVGYDVAVKGLSVVVMDPCDFILSHWEEAQHPSKGGYWFGGSWHGLWWLGTPWWAHSGVGRPPMLGPLAQICPVCDILHTNSLSTSATCYWHKYALEMLFSLWSKAVDDVLSVLFMSFSSSTNMITSWSYPCFREL